MPLANTRVSFARNSAGAPEILDTNNYYPFGLNHTGGNGINSSGFGSWQSYKYNGKELQETGMYDYGARFYMSDLGRWGVIDPLAEQMRRYSPYNYAFNNPISFIDPDGRKPRTRDAEEASVMYPKSLWGFFMQGGQKDTTALIDFIAQNNGVGSFQNIMKIMESSGGVSNSSSSSNSSGGGDTGSATTSSNDDGSVNVNLDPIVVTVKKGYNLDELHNAMMKAFENTMKNVEKQLAKNDWEATSKNISAFGLGNDVKAELIEAGVRKYAGLTYKEFNLLNATSQELRTVAALGNEGSKYLKGIKFLGKAIGVLGVLEAGYGFLDNPTPGNFLKLSVNTALLVAKVNPAIAVTVAVLDATGATDFIYKSVDNSLGY